MAFCALLASARPSSPFLPVASQIHVHACRDTARCLCTHVCSEGHTHSGETEAFTRPFTVRGQLGRPLCLDSSPPAHAGAQVPPPSA